MGWRSVISARFALAAQMYYAERVRLLALVRAAPELLFGDDQAALAGALQRQGLSLMRAADVGAKLRELTSAEGSTALSASSVTKPRALAVLMNFFTAASDRSRRGLSFSGVSDGVAA